MTPTPDDNELRIRIYREAWADAERENARLREEIERLQQHKARYQEEILDLERHNEELFAALNSVRNTLMRAGDDIETLIRVD